MLTSTECREPAEWRCCSSVNTNSCAWCMTGDYIPFRGWAGCSSWSTARRLIRFHLVWRAALSACTRGTPWNTGDNCTFHSGSSLFTYLFYFCIAATTATTSKLLDSIGPPRFSSDKRRRATVVVIDVSAAKCHLVHLLFRRRRQL